MSDPTEQPITQQRFLPINDFLKGRSWPTKTSIRFYIYHNRYNFESRCVRRVGRKVLIDTQEFDKWILDQSQLPQT